MNKIFKYTAAFAALSFCLTGCSIASETKTADIPENLSSSFSSDITITTEDIEGTAHISKSDDGIWNALFSEPSSLSGIEFVFENDSVSANYKGLSFSVPQSALPVQSALQNLIYVTDNLKTNEDETGEALEKSYECIFKDDNYQLDGTLDNGEFTFILDKNGCPLSFEMKNFGLMITFSNFSTDPDQQPMSETSSESENETGSSSAESEAETEINSSETISDTMQ